MKTTTQLLAAALVALSMISANAQTTQSGADIPRIISYQGQLRSGATVIRDGDHLFTARLYNDANGSTLVWKGTYHSAVSNGVFSLQLGSDGQALPEAGALNANLYLSIEVDGSGELKPFTQMTASAYALNVANGAITKEKMGTDYVSSIRVDGKKITQRGGALNINSGAGITLTFDQERNALVVSNDLTNGTGIHAQAVTTVANGGTGVSSIPNHGIAIGHNANNITATTLGSGEILIGTNNNDPVAGSLTGTANQIIVNNGNGSITLSTPQNIGTTSSPTFKNVTSNGTLSAIDFSASGNGSIDGDALIKGNLTSNTDLSIKGNTTLNSDLTVKKNVSTDGTLYVKKNLTSDGNLILNGKATSTATTAGDAATTLTTKGYVDAKVNAAGGAGSGWSLSGNAATVAGTNFLGTTDLVNLSIKTNSVERMKITSDGAVLFAGTSGAVPVSGAGTRLMWVPSKGALRAGIASFDEWDAANVGTASTGFGNAALGFGNYSTALGYFTSAYGVASTAFGSGSAAAADGSTAFGSAATAFGINSVAMGDATTADGDGSTAMGGSTTAGGLYSTATGYQTTTTNNYSFVSGRTLKVGLSSFGFNGSTTGALVDMSTLNNIAYLGDVDLIIGNDDNTARGIKFCVPSGSSNVSATRTTTIKAGAQSANISYTLPSSQGAAGSVLSNNGSGSLSWYTNPVAAYGTVAAGATITIPSNTTVIKINDDADSTSVNAVTMPSGSNGTIIYIYNNDAQATAGDITLAASSMGIYVYVDGWKKAN